MRAKSISVSPVGCLFVFLLFLTCVFLCGPYRKYLDEKRRLRTEIRLGHVFQEYEALTHTTIQVENPSISYPCMIFEVEERYPFYSLPYFRKTRSGEWPFYNGIPDAGELGALGSVGIIQKERYGGASYGPLGMAAGNMTTLVSYTRHIWIIDTHSRRVTAFSSFKPSPLPESITVSGASTVEREMFDGEQHKEIKQWLDSLPAK